MPKRNRAKEIKRHGELVANPMELSGPRKDVRAEVTDDDLRAFGGLALWAHRYVNYIYEHGGHPGSPLPKRASDLIFWHHGSRGFRAKGVYLSAHSSGRRGLRMQALGDVGYEEYVRQSKLGLEFVVSTEWYEQSSDWRAHTEDVRLVFDADGAIVDGGYFWFGPSEDTRPVSNADFISLEEAHEATVSRRAAALLSRFRELVIDAHSDIDLHGVWNYQLAVTPPLELHAIPDFPPAH